MISPDRIREDFDRLARPTAEDGELPGPYDAFLLTMPEVEAVCRERLPGARARRHLQWRYTIVWTRPRG